MFLFWGGGHVGFLIKILGMGPLFNCLKIKKNSFKKEIRKINKNF